MFLNEVKRYLRVEHSDDDASIQALIEVAAQYIYDATGVRVEAGGDPRARGAVCLIVADLYEERNTERDPFAAPGIQRLLVQLRHSKKESATNED